MYVKRDMYERSHGPQLVENMDGWCEVRFQRKGHNNNYHDCWKRKTCGKKTQREGKMIMM